VTLASNGDGEFVLQCTGLRPKEHVTLNSASLEAACTDADFNGDEGADVDTADIEGVVHETVELTKCAAGNYSVEVSQNTTPFKTISVGIQVDT
jgi:hypothetical protein